jgi:4-oxalocrotonate tautomerase
VPIIHVHMFEGRTIEQKRKLVEKVTDAVVTSVGSPPEDVKIILHDLPRHNVATAGVLASDRKG